MMNKRISWLDLVKGIAICGVVMGHSITQGIGLYMNIHWTLLPIAYMLFIFVMPVFFAVSGYLYIYKPVHSLKSFYVLLYKKISSFLIPYITFTFLIFLMNQIHNYDYKHIIIWKNLLQEFCVAPSYIWFLYALFFIFILTSVMDLLHCNLFIEFIFYFILLLIQLHFSWYVGSYTPCGICSFGIFFWLGEIINKYSKMINTFIICLFILFIFTFGVLMYYLVFLRRTELNINNVSIYSIIPKILSVPVVFKFCELLTKLKNIIVSYFIKIGKYTLIIYLIHFNVVRLFGKLLIHFIKNPLINLILVFSMGWAVSIFICKLAEKMKLLKFIFYTRSFFNKFLYNTKIGNKLNIK